MNEKNNKNDSEKISIQSINQSGGITAYNVNVGKPERQLTLVLCNQLDKIISDYPNREIEIITEMNDNETYRFGQQIFDYLSSKGHKIPKGISRMMANQPLQTRINANTDKPVIEIIIGSQ